MNRGSALKWADALESGDYRLNNGGGLHYDDGSMCLVGVLEDLITGGWNETHLGQRTSCEGSVTFPSKNTAVRCKLKTDLQSVADRFTGSGDKDPHYWANWIRQNYERL